MKKSNESLRRRAPRSLPLLMLLGLSACGGGGGERAIAPEPQAAVTLSEIKLSCAVGPGESCPDMSVTARLPASAADERPDAVEAPGAAVPLLKLPARQKQADGSWRFSFDPQAELAAGSYSGTLEFYILEPLPSLGLLPRNYDRVRTPFQLSVAGREGKLGPLLPLAGAPEWAGYNGNARHTGLVPVTLNPANFTRRWTWIGARTPFSNSISPVVSGNGLVYFSTSEAMVDGDGKPSNKLSATLTALSEANGAPQWRYQELDLNAGFGAPALAGQRLLMLAEGGMLYSFDAPGGAKLGAAQQPGMARLFGSGSQTVAPTPSDGQVYFGGGSSVVGADALSGANRWSAGLGLSLLEGVSNWTPAVAAGMVYSNVNGELRAYRAADGGQVFSVAVPGFSASGLLRKYSLNQAPVLTDGGGALLLNQRYGDNAPLDNSLSLVDLASRTLRWTVQGQFTTAPVVAGEVLYIGNQASGLLEARRVGDGTLLWSWPLAGAKEERFFGDLVLSNNLLFVAGGRNTYAIDLATHQTVWTYRMSGSLALSPNGLLYIAKPGAVLGAAPFLTAINLR